MDQIVTIWRGLGGRRQIVVALATVLTFAAILGLSGAFTQTSMALLYSGLEGARAGEVLQALEQQGVRYEVRGGSILVPESQRDELRMGLAAQGLPANGGAGYELLDSMSGFGTTSQMFDAAYWRAKEGELARTISAAPDIRSARVHLANPGRKTFHTHSRPTASVAVTTTSGRLSGDQARAIRYLVASAVNEMLPEDVSVIDGTGTLIVAGEEARSDGHERADELRQGVERLLAARVGPGNAVVELSLDVVRQTESVTERLLEPGTRVAISTETEERSDAADKSGAGQVTVASNLPEGADGTGDRSKSETSETRERVNYEVSETRREIHRGAGETRRLTVAVLVNGIRATDASGQTVWQERSAEELAALQELVASAVGFDAERGDVITIRSLPFEQVAEAGTEVAAPSGGLDLDVMKLAQMAILAGVALVLGLFVLRPALVSRRPAVALDDSLPPAAVSAEQPAVLPALEIGSAPEFASPESGFPTMAIGDFGEAGGADDGDPVARLKRLIGERREETVEVLRSWMDQKEST